MGIRRDERRLEGPILGGERVNTELSSEGADANKLWRRDGARREREELEQGVLKDPYQSLSSVVMRSTSESCSMTASDQGIIVYHLISGGTPRQKEYLAGC